MIFEETGLAGVIRVIEQPHRDARGSFSRLYCPLEFASAGIAFSPMQVNLSRNTHQHTLRGLHWQDAPFAEAKFIKVMRGSIFEVVVDLRPDSRTYREHITLTLGAGGGDALFLPEGVAHGFLTLEPETDLLYQMGAMHVPGHSRGLRWDDPALGIRWPHPPAVISDADRGWPLLSRSA